MAGALIRTTEAGAESIFKLLREPPCVAIDRSKEPEERGWTWDETVMAAHLYLNRPATHGGAVEADIERLGTVLWRTRGSIGSKIANLKASSPDYQGRGFANDNDQDPAVIRAWFGRRAELSERFHELVRAFTGGVDWADVITHPLTKRRKLPGRPNPVPDEADRRRRAMEASKGLRRPPAPRTSTVRDPAAQRAFREGVLASYGEHGASPASCPGCGHSRPKANGEALFEAHHLVPVAEDACFDYRIGAPLCANCHWLSTVGSVEQRRAITASLLVNHPGILPGLREAIADGVLPEAAILRLREDGLLPH